MARLPRLVIPELPHQVTQRGRQGRRPFLEDDDYALYRDLLAAQCALAGVEVWAWCLMPDHVHLILVPSTEDALALALGEAHRSYTRALHARKEVSGNIWHGRFASTVLDLHHLLVAVRYVELNPLRAGLVEHARDWPWSSARAHLDGAEDGLTQSSVLRELVPDWASFLTTPPPHQDAEALRMAVRTGRPIGNQKFLLSLEQQAGRRLRAKKPGPRGSQSESPRA